MKGAGYTVGFMVLITVVFTTAVSLVNALTADRVAINDQLAQRRHILLALDLTDDPTLPARDTEDLFLSRVGFMDEVTGMERIYTRLSTEGEIEALAFPSGRGQAEAAR